MQFNQIQKPEEKFKNMVLDCLDRSILNDTRGDKKAFNKSMKHFLRMVSPRMTAAIRAEIVAKEVMMSEKLEKDISGKTKDDIEAITIAAEYKFFDEIEYIGINTLFNSGMFPRETGATLSVGRTMGSLNAVGEAIRNDRDVESTEEEGDDAFSDDGA